jgi:hypothetical protein
MTTAEEGHPTSALTADVEANPVPQGVKLGNRRTHTRPRLWFHHYLEGSATSLTLPEGVHRSHREHKWKMLANGPDPEVTLSQALAEFGCGDCFIAKMLYAIQHAAIVSGKPVPDFTADECVDIYSRWFGFDPKKYDRDGNNPTDQGSEPNEGFAKWVGEGVPLPGGGVDKPEGVLAVHPTRPMDWQRAIYEFDFLMRGLGMPVAAEGQRVWDVPTNGRLTGDYAPYSWGGHEVIDFSYDQNLTADGTWGEIRLKTRKFDVAYTDQLTVVLTPDILSRTGISPLGFNYDRLRADWEAIYRR